MFKSVANEVDGIKFNATMTKWHLQNHTVSKTRRTLNKM